MRRIFLVGCPRSGTTLVQSLLASAPGMVTFTESHFFDKCFGPLYMPFHHRGFDRGCIEATVDRFSRENALEADGISAQTWSSAESLASWFVEALDRHAASRAGTGWIEKTPDHLHKIGLIATAAPDAVFVHVLRKPAPTIDSLERASMAWGNPRSWLAFAIKWVISVFASATYLDKPGHLHVFYEDIVENSRNESKKLFDWLGLEWDEGVLERYRLVADEAIAPGESWKQRNVREIGVRSDEPSAQNRLRKVLIGPLNLFYNRVKRRAARVD